MAQRTIAQNPLKPLRGGFGKRGAGGVLVGTGGEALAEISPLVPAGRTLKSDGNNAWNTGFPDGKILQAAVFTSTTPITVSANSSTVGVYYDLFSGSITLSADSSQVLLIGNLPAYAINGYGGCLIKRTLPLPANIIYYFGSGFGFNTAPAYNFQPHIGTVDALWLDSPNQPALTTLSYMIQAECNINGGSLNFMPFGQAASLALLEVGVI